MLAALASATIGVDFNLAVDFAQAPGGGDGFGEIFGGVTLVEENLPLKVAQFDQIAIDQAEKSDAGSNEHFGGGRAESTAADDQDAGTAQAHLAIAADLGEDFLAIVAGHVKSLPARL